VFVLGSQGAPVGARQSVVCTVGMAGGRTRWRRGGEGMSMSYDNGDILGGRISGRS